MVEHSPNPAEMATLRLLQDEYEFEYVSVRLTKTMLEKAIIDAHDALRIALAQAGVVAFATMGQGQDSKLVVRVPLITQLSVTERDVSFYRPNTKSGDPRTWISRLNQEASEGDLLLFLFDRAGGHGMVGLMLLGKAYEDIVRNAGQLLRPRLDRWRDDKLFRVAQRIREGLEPLRDRWIPTKRAGPTGIGYTLESLLGINANVFQGADVDGVELKAYRRGSTQGQGKLVTLFSKTPKWVHEGRGLGLLNRYGYVDDNGRKALYCTVAHQPNSLGWRLDTNADEERINVMHNMELGLYYHISTLEQRLKEKHTATLFIMASTRGSRASEHYQFDGLVYCARPSMPNFMSLIAQSQVGLDFTLHVKTSGSARDHGYLWRIREPKIPDLFAYRNVLYDR
jgi:hypothetical protein